MKQFTIVIALIFILVLLLPTSSLAHRDDYIKETLVYVTLERMELEPEYWFDYGYGVEQNLYFYRHNLAVEYGITDHLMIDSRISFENVGGKGLGFQSGRFEMRYRFADEGVFPVDIAISGEINSERMDDGSSRVGIEPRFIASKDFALLNLTLNLAEEVPMNGGDVSSNASFGFRYGTQGFLRFGSELKYDTDHHEGSVIPQMWFAFPNEITLKVGVSLGFARNRENYGRLALEVGL